MTAIYQNVNRNNIVISNDNLTRRHKEHISPESSPVNLTTGTNRMKLTHELKGDPNWELNEIYLKSTLTNNGTDVAGAGVSFDLLLMLAQDLEIIIDGDTSAEILKNEDITMAIYDKINSQSSYDEFKTKFYGFTNNRTVWNLSAQDAYLNYNNASIPAGGSQEFYSPLSLIFGSLFSKTNVAHLRKLQLRWSLTNDPVYVYRYYSATGTDSLANLAWSGVQFVFEYVYKGKNAKLYKSLVHHVPFYETRLYQYGPSTDVVIDLSRDFANLSSVTHVYYYFLSNAIGGSLNKTNTRSNAYKWVNSSGVFYVQKVVFSVNGEDFERQESPSEMVTDTLQFWSNMGENKEMYANSVFAHFAAPQNINMPWLLYDTGMDKEGKHEDHINAKGIDLTQYGRVQLILTMGSTVPTSGDYALAITVCANRFLKTEHDPLSNSGKVIVTSRK